MFWSLVLLAEVLLIFRPIFGCGTDVSGAPSTSAQFQITFQPPLIFTYPPSITTYTTGQSINNASASNRLISELNSAVSTALKSNSISLISAPMLSVSGFSGLAATVEAGANCTADKNYIQYSGTLIYQCSGASSGSTEAPTTQAVQTSTDGGDGAEGDTTISATTSASASGTFTKILVQQSMQVSANSTQSLYLAQWQEIAKSVQIALEAKNMVFLDDISVNI
ncbi:unnamed protein product [Caenorhabditis angaria]|uniref:SEA domain-containing protein n=1 Tax=Caenorhabditis angaria TaxID=860376 RepID=A0A9P1N3X9_9PELO|nr:unnamed protein product [Caenorhabditis angaria]